jgi:hypothetical protein
VKLLLDENLSATKPMDTPRYELSITRLSGQALLESLLTMFESRTDRFSIQPGLQDNGLCRAIVRDQWGSSPPWAIGLEMIKGKLMGYVAEAFDPDIGNELYEEQVRHAAYVWLSLLAAEGNADLQLRKVPPEQPGLSG